jgi:vacuolar-type H+-ATPase subunit F/Vma7
MKKLLAVVLLAVVAVVVSLNMTEEKKIVTLKVDFNKSNDWFIYNSKLFFDTIRDSEEDVEFQVEIIDESVIEPSTKLLELIEEYRTVDGYSILKLRKKILNEIADLRDEERQRILKAIIPIPANTDDLIESLNSESE